MDDNGNAFECSDDLEFIDECKCPICQGIPNESIHFKYRCETSLQDEFIDDWDWQDQAPEAHGPHQNEDIFDPLERMEKYEYNPFSAMLESDPADQAAGFIYLDFLDWLFGVEE